MFRFTSARSRAGPQRQWVLFGLLIIGLPFLMSDLAPAMAADSSVIPAVENRVPKWPGFKRHDGPDFEVQYPAGWTANKAAMPQRRRLHMYGGDDRAVSLVVTELALGDPGATRRDARQLIKVVVGRGKDNREQFVRYIDGGTLTKAGYAFTWKDSRGRPYLGMTMLLMTHEHDYELTLLFPPERLSGQEAARILATFRAK